MQKFNKISQYSNVIKNLLASTYLPLVRSVREGDYICAGRLYVFRCEVIKCNSSGYIGSGKFLSNLPLASWDRIQEFHFGDTDGKLSTNYISNAEGYDYKTHERFGQYLRNLRDMYGLNLLSLYNCFSNQPLENHIIEPQKIVETSRNNNTKIYKVPIRFNQDYTICIENLGVTTFAPAFIRYNKLLKQNNTRYGNNVDVTNQYLALHQYDNIYSFANTSFGRPIKLRFDNKPGNKTIKYKTFSPGPEKTGYRLTQDDLQNIPVDSTKKYYTWNGTSFEEITKLPILGLDVDKLYEYMHWDGDEPPENSLAVDCEYTYSYTRSSEIITETAIQLYSLTITDPGEESCKLQTSGYTILAVYEKATNTWELKCVLGDEVYPFDGVLKLKSPIDSSSEDLLNVANIIGYYTTDTLVYEEYSQETEVANDVTISYEITDEIVNQYADLEDNLYLLIQVPAVFNQNIVVLEGDYTSLESQKIVDYLVINELPDFLYDQYYTHDLNLMTATSTEPRPFSPVLVEFILWNAISTLDTINNDMDRLSLSVNSKYIPFTEDTWSFPNYWTPRYRQAISDFARRYDRNTIQDNLGYVTTVIEEDLNKD